MALSCDLSYQQPLADSPKLSFGNKKQLQFDIVEGLHVTMAKTVIQHIFFQDEVSLNSVELTSESSCIRSQIKLKFPILACTYMM